MTEINLCSPAQEAQNEEINLCPEEQDRVINLCLGDCTAPLPALFLTGPTEPIDGDTYEATGGVEPYTFSTTCGTISSAGVLTGLGDCCGAGSVTVVDSCGQTASGAVDFGEFYELVGSFDAITDHPTSSCSAPYAVDYIDYSACNDSRNIRAICNGNNRNYSTIATSRCGMTIMTVITSSVSVFFGGYHRWRVYWDEYESRPCV